MRHRLRNRIIIRCLSSGVTGCVRFNWVCHKPDDTDVKPGDALKLGVTDVCPDVRPMTDP